MEALWSHISHPARSPPSESHTFVPHTLVPRRASSSRVSPELTPAWGLHPSHHHRGGGAGSLPHLLADELRGHWPKGQEAAMETKTWSKTHQGAEPSWGTFPLWGCSPTAAPFLLHPEASHLGKKGQPTLPMLATCHHTLALEILMLRHVAFRVNNSFLGDRDYSPTHG